MAAWVRELTIQLDEQTIRTGERRKAARGVTAVVVDGDGRPPPSPDAPAPIGAALRNLWDSADNDLLRTRLAKALFPPSARPRFRAAVQALDHGQSLRIRLRLPTSAEQQPFTLAELPWEAVRVPAPAAGPGIWDTWVHDPERSPVPYGELGRDERFTLVREVLPARPVATSAQRAYGRVVIADATGVHGELRTATGAHPVGRPGDQETAAADGRLVRSALDRSHLEADAVPSPASAETIRRWLLAGAGAFYFGGHHTEGGLVVADRPGSTTPALLDGGTLTQWLLEHEVPLAVLLACDSAGPAAGAGSASGQRHPVALSLAERMAREGVPHVVAVQGKVSHDQAVRFAGAFFASLADGDDIDVALGRSSGAFTDSVALPVLYTARGNGRHLSVGLHTTPRRRPPELSTAAHRIAQGSKGRVLPDERFRVSLETRWALSTHVERQPCAWDVLADPSGADLTEPMNETERMLHRAGLPVEPPLYEPRHWYAYDHDETPGRPNRQGELVRALRPTYRPRRREADALDPPHRGVGLIVRKLATRVTDHGFVQDLRQLPLLDWDLRMVVVQVHGPGERLDTVRRAADAVARELGLSEYVVRARTQGGEDTAGFDAAAVVDDLNRDDGRADVEEETERLHELMLSRPAAYRKVSVAHAENRVGRARYASLCLAASDDADLDRWLSAAAAGGLKLPVPDDFRGLTVSSAVIEAVVVGLIRSKVLGWKDALAAWSDEGLSRPVRWAADIATATDAKEEHVTAQDLRDPELAIALDRAGLIPPHFRGLDPAGLRPGSWALLARRQPTEEDAEWLCGMEPAVRRLAGLEPDRGDYDFQLQHDLYACQYAFRPDPPHPT